MSRIAHIFFDVHMSYAHTTLTKMIGEKTKLETGETAIFIAKNWKAVKLLTADNTILYHRNNKLGINPETIKHLPNCVEGGKLNYQKALETVLTKRFGAIKK